MVLSIVWSSGIQGLTGAYISSGMGCQQDEELYVTLPLLQLSELSLVVLVRCKFHMKYCTELSDYVHIISCATDSLFQNSNDSWRAFLNQKAMVY